MSYDAKSDWSLFVKLNFHGIANYGEKIALDWKSSVEKYCCIWQTAYISQKKARNWFAGSALKIIADVVVVSETLKSIFSGLNDV